MNKNDARFQLPKIEDIIINVPYAITISPPKGKATRDMRREIWKLSEQISAVCNGFDLELYYEYSAQIRCHVHGFITIKDIHNYMFGVQGLQILGALCIKPLFTIAGAECEGYSKWLSYCQKQCHVIAPMICIKGSLLSYPMCYKDKAINYLPQ